MQWMQSWIRFKGSKQFLQPNWNKTSLCRVVHVCLGEACSGTWRERWDADSFACLGEELREKGLVQMWLRIPWSSVSDLLVLRGPEWWNGTLPWIAWGKTQPALAPSSSVWGVGGGLCGSWVFPAAAAAAAAGASCAGEVGQAVTVGFSQHIQTSLSLVHLEWFISRLRARISPEHFPSTISSCGLGFGLVFGFLFSFLFFSVQGEIPSWIQRLWNRVGVGVLLGTGTWQGLALPFPLVLGWEGFCVCPQQFASWADWGGWARGVVWNQTHSSWVHGSCSLSPGSRCSPSAQSSPCSLWVDGHKLSCSADVKDQEVQITPNFQF